MEKDDELSDAENSHPIEYIDFPDYAKIIAKRDNWHHAFKIVFSSKEAIVVKLQELVPIRNALAHNRELAERQKKKLIVYHDDIMSRIKNLDNISDR